MGTTALHSTVGVLARRYNFLEVTTYFFKYLIEALHNPKRCLFLIIIYDVHMHRPQVRYIRTCKHKENREGKE